MLIQTRKEKIVIDLRGSDYEEIDGLARIIFSVAEMIALDPTKTIVVRKSQQRLDSKVVVCQY